MITRVMLNGSIKISKRAYASLSQAVKVEEVVESYQERTRLAEIERDSLEIVKSLRSDPDIVEHIPYSRFSKGAIEHGLTASSLRGPDMIIVPPVCFYNKSYTELTTIIHLGKNMCGHDGIIHGGLAATILDEALAGVAVPSFAAKGGCFTANLNINYKRPIVSDQWVLLKSKLDKSEGRKAYVSANIQSLDGKTIFTEATSLFVAPKIPIKNP